MATLDEPLIVERRGIGMTPEEALADEALAEHAKTTPGPWAYEFTGEKDNSWGLGIIIGANDEPVIGLNEDLDAEVETTICVNDGGSSDSNLADPEWIAHAHEREPLLAQAVRDLVAENGSLRHNYEREMHNLGIAPEQLSEAQTRIAELEDAAKQARQSLQVAATKTRNALIGDALHFLEPRGPHLAPLD